MTSFGTSGTLKILILFTIKNLEGVQDTAKSRQRIHGKVLHLIRLSGENGFGDKAPSFINESLQPSSFISLPLCTLKCRCSPLVYFDAFKNWLYIL